MLPFLDDRWGNPSSHLRDRTRSTQGHRRSAREARARDRLRPRGGRVHRRRHGGGQPRGQGSGVGAREPRAGTSCSRSSSTTPCSTPPSGSATRGFEIEFLPVDASRHGRTATSSRERLRDDTLLVCVMLANNEIGTIEPVAEIAAICRERGVLVVHRRRAGARQDPRRREGARRRSRRVLRAQDRRAEGDGRAVRPARREARPAHARRRTGTRTPLGNREPGRRRRVRSRAPTVVVGELDDAGAAVARAARPSARRDCIERIDDVRLNGHATTRLPHNLNVSVRGVVGEDVLLMLDAQGICASTGSACQSGSVEPSYVLACVRRPAGVGARERCASRSAATRPTPTSTPSSRRCRRSSTASAASPSTGAKR